MKLFTIYDSKAGAYLEPIIKPRTADALRAFEFTCNQERHDFNTWPADYTLFEIGEFDSDTGKIKQHDQHINLGLAADFIKKQIASPQLAQ